MRLPTCVVVLSAALLGLALPTSALAGLPGEEAPVLGVDALGTSAADLRSPLSVGGRLTFAAPLHRDPLVPDLEARAELTGNRMPPREVEDFMRANPGPDASGGAERIDYTRLQSRMEATASWGATSREPGLRLRVGPLAVIDGDAGAMSALEPVGYAPDYTMSLRAGLTGAFGVALPFGEEIGDPLLDLRLGGSVASPLVVSGGRLDDPDFRDFALTVDDKTFREEQLAGRESRLWGEATFTVDHFRVGVDLGFNHRARSAIQRARAESPNWEVLDQPQPVDLLGRVTVGAIF